MSIKYTLHIVNVAQFEYFTFLLLFHNKTLCKRKMEEPPNLINPIGNMTKQLANKLEIVEYIINLFHDRVLL